MKKIVAIAALSIGLAVSAGVSAAERTVTLGVKNLFCATCPFIVKRTLARVDGVKQVQVSFKEKTAIVTFDDRKTTITALTKATSDAGFPSHIIR